ncbi:MAG: hypothetical protein MI743_05040 [Sneathiellales bacterium]|nr:hypothetical protein [Sneathiellales bacterium]
MFSRNEKYGNALHLPYGSNVKVFKPVNKENNGFWATLREFFNKTNSTHQDPLAQPIVEIDLDRSTIEQAVNMELRNANSAANENQQEMMTGKSA